MNEKARAYARAMLEAGAPSTDVFASLKHTYGYGIIEAKKIYAAAQFDLAYGVVRGRVEDPAVVIALDILKGRIDAIT